MADATIRIYIQYDLLYLSEFRALTRDIEAAYNIIDSSIVKSHRIKRRRRLIIQTVHTGNSLTSVLLGAIVPVLLLSKIVIDACKVSTHISKAIEANAKANIAISKAAGEKLKLEGLKYEIDKKRFIAEEAKWKSEYSKFRALREEHKFQKALSGNELEQLETRIPESSLTKAQKIIKKRVERIGRSKTITDVDITFSPESGNNKE